MTSAPRSARCRVASGAATACSQATTRSPASGSVELTKCRVRSERCAAPHCHARLHVAKLGVQVVGALPVTAAERVVELFAQPRKLSLAGHPWIAQGLRLLCAKPLPRYPALPGLIDLRRHLHQTTWIARMQSSPGAH